MGFSTSPCNEFVEVLASKAPVPGGGGASAQGRPDSGDGDRGGQHPVPGKLWRCLLRRGGAAGGGSAAPGGGGMHPGGLPV